jgi:hypothetical protein
VDPRADRKTDIMYNHIISMNHRLVNNNGVSQTVFWYNVPFVAYGGFAGVYYSSQLTGYAADFA